MDQLIEAILHLIVVFIKMAIRTWLIVFIGAYFFLSIFGFNAVTILICMIVAPIVTGVIVFSNKEV